MRVTFPTEQRLHPVRGALPANDAAYRRVPLRVPVRRRHLHATVHPRLQGQLSGTLPYIIMITNILEKRSPIFSTSTRLSTLFD